MNPKPDEHEPIPLQPDAGPAALRPGREPGASAGRADPAPPILELASEPCPRCGAAIEPGETECLSCGYELRPAPPQPPGTARADRVDDQPLGALDEPFVVPGRGRAQVIAGCGAAVTLGAMVLAAVQAPPGSPSLVLGVLARVVFNVALHTGTGVAAVAVAARLSERRLGPFELAAARMFLAYAAFELVRHVPITIPHVGGVLAYLLAAAAYWAILWALFWRGRSAALTIGLAHVVLWLVINLGMDLSAWVRHKEAAMRAAMPPPAAAPQ